MPRIHHDLSLTIYALIGLGVLGYDIFGLGFTLIVAAVLGVALMAASLVAAMLAFIKDGRRCCSAHRDNDLPARTSGDHGVSAR